MDSSTIILYTQEFDSYSLRPLVALYEGAVSFKLVEVPVVNPPPWLFTLSPQGTLPTCKIGDLLVHGTDAVCSVLEKEFPKIAKLLISKRKNYSSMLQHCRTKFEPAVDELLNNEDESRLEALREALYLELDLLETSIKGPYILGKEVSWVCSRSLALFTG